LIDSRFPASPHKIAEVSLAQHGYSDQELELVRIGTNAVFFAGPVVVRVSPPDYPRRLLQQQIDLASWLTRENFLTAAPLSDLHYVADCPVTLWVRIPSSRRATMHDLGQIARSFHDATNTYPGILPEWEPLGRLGDRLSQLKPDETISAAECSLLQDWKRTLTKTVANLQFALPTGPIHGDIHAGNVVASGDRCYLVDFDRIAYGPREWDLADPLAGMYFFEGDHDWPAFVEEYGYDLRQFNGAEDLVRLRGLFMLSWLLTLERTSEVRSEIATRLEYFKEPDRAFPKWSAV
jgi:Ser/Thr protein kinase RdoA (MazF antagonist)